MAKYTILPRVRQPGFKVEVIGDDGSRSTMLGFQDHDEATAWVETSRRMETVRGAAGSD